MRPRTLDVPGARIGIAAAAIDKQASAREKPTSLRKDPSGIVIVSLGVDEERNAAGKRTTVGEIGTNSGRGALSHGGVVLRGLGRRGQQGIVGQCIDIVSAPIKKHS